MKRTSRSLRPAHAQRQCRREEAAAGNAGSGVRRRQQETQGGSEGEGEGEGESDGVQARALPQKQLRRAHAVKCCGSVPRTVF
jgi:hypothetical protein